MSLKQDESDNTNRTSMAMDSEVLERFKRLKPFNSMSHAEMLSLLLDTYEQQRKERLAEGHELLNSDAENTHHSESNGGKK